MTKADLWRSYGLERPSSPRYKSNERKSILWWLTSVFVRIRDFRLYGRCISCGKELHWASGQAGHYAPAGNCGIGLLFDPLNIALECPRCNGTDEGHLIGYRRELVARRGLQSVLELEERYQYHQRHPGEQKEWTQGMYHDKIVALIACMTEENMLPLDAERES